MTLGRLQILSAMHLPLAFELSISCGRDGFSRLCPFALSAKDNNAIRFKAKGITTAFVATFDNFCIMLAASPESD